MGGGRGVLRGREGGGEGWEGGGAEKEIERERDLRERLNEGKRLSESG